MKSLESEYLDIMDEGGIFCEHGMSAWLCMGPMHYPSRQDEMEGRYF